MKDKVLIVDDESFINELIVDHLEKDGFSAKGASSGEEALPLVQKMKWDLCLVDIVMEKMDGIELLGHIKKIAPDVPVIMITGKGSINTALAALKMGAEDYLLKPFDPVTLSHRIRSVIKSNKERVDQIKKRKQAEKALHKANVELEKKVQQRTAELSKINTELLKEIAKRKGKEQALIESTQKFFTIISTMNEGLLYTDNDEIILFANDQFCEQLGYSYRELLGEKVDKLLLDKGNRSLLAKKRHDRLRGKSGQYEIRAKKKSGEQIWLLISAAPVKKNGKIIGSVGIQTDITEKKKLEIELERFRVMIDQTAETVIIIDSKTSEIIDVNEAACTKLGYSRDELLKLKVGDIQVGFELSNKKEWRKLVKRLKESDKPVLYESGVHKRKDGSTFPVDVNVSFKALKGKDYILAVARDITERQRIEKSKQILYDISKAIHSTENLDDLFKSIHKSLGELIDTTNFCITAYEKDTDTMTFPYYVGKNDKPAKVLKLKGSNTKIEQVIRKRKPVFVSGGNHKKATAKNEVRKLGSLSRCWLGVPLKVKDNIIGVMAVWSYTDPNTYSDKDIELLEFVSEQVATAIESKRSDEALRKSEENYRTLVEQMNEGLMKVDNNGVVQYINDQYCEMIGYTREEIIGKRSMDIWVSKEHRQLIRKKIDLRLKGISDKYELLIDKKSGDSIWIMTSGAPIFDADGIVTGSVGTMTDITEQKLAEKALRESEERFRRAFDDASIGMAMLDLKGKYLKVNGTFTNMLGYSREELLNKTFNDISYPDDLQLGQEILNIMLSGGNDSAKYERRYLHKSGKIIWVSLQSKLLRDNDNKPLHIITQIIDITDKMFAEQTLQKSEEQLSLALKGGNLGMWDYNVQTGEAYFDRNWLGMLGYSLGEIESNVRGWEGLIHPEDKQYVIKKLRAHFKNPDTKYEVEKRLKTKSGDYKWILAKGEVLVRDENGTPIRMLGTHLDITDRKQAEKKLKYRVEFEKLVSTISTKFINLSPKQVGKGINAALKGIGEFAKVERSYVFEFNETLAEFSNTYEWCAKGIEPQIEEIKSLSMSDLPWIARKIMKLKPVQIKRVSALPVRAKKEKERWKKQNIKSLIVVPMVHGKKLIGFLGIDAVISEKLWTEEDVVLLKTIAEIIANELNRKKADEKLKQKNELLSALSRIQEQVIGDTDSQLIFDKLLESLLLLTKSEYGFIGEVLYNSRNMPYLKTHAITNIAWNKETRELYEKNGPDGFEFRNLKTLFGAVLTSGKPVISNDPAHDPRNGGLPKGHPPLNAFLGVPFRKGKNMIGMVGIANKEGGYDEELITYLQPFLAVCTTIIEAYKSLQQRRQSEQALQESEEKFRQISEQSIVGMSILQDGVVKYGNEGLSRIFEYSIKEILEWQPEEFSKIIHADDKSFVLDQVTKKMKGEKKGVIEHYSLRIVTKTGKEKWVDNFSKTIQFNGKPADLVTLVDISERIEAEEQLKKLSSALAQTDDLVLITDKEGVIEYVNDAFEKNVGYSREELIGQKSKILKSGKHTQKYFERLWNTILNGDVFRGVMINKRRNGELFYVEKSITPLKNDKNIITHFLSTGKDITERMQEEEKQRLLTHQKAIVAELEIYALSGMELDLLMDKAVKRTANVLDVEYCKILELLPGGKSLLLRSGVGWKRGLVGKAKVRAAKNTHAGRTLLAKKPIIVKDLQSDKRFRGPKLLTDHKVVSGISVVIHGKDSPYGALGAHSKKKRIFTPDDIHFFQSVANVISNAIARRHSEKELSESEAKTRAIVETAVDGIITISDRGIVESFNTAAEKMFCYTAEEVIGQNVNMLMPSPFREDHDGYVENYLRTGKKKIIGIGREVLGKRKNGTTFPLELAVSEMQLGDQNMFTGIVRDVTERKKAELELIREREKLIQKFKHEKLISTIASSLNSSYSCKSVLDSVFSTIQTTLSICNVSFYSIEGKRSEVIRIGKRYSKNTFPKTKTLQKAKFSELPEDLKVVIRKGELWKSSDLSEFEEETQEFFRNRNIYAVVISPVLIGSKTVGWICFNQNRKFEWADEIITLLQTIANMISNAWNRDHHYYARLDEEKKRTEAVNLAERSSHLASIGALAAGIAHEISQPLNALQVTANSMLYWDKRKHVFSKDEILEDLSFISKQVNRVDEIIKNMRVLARQEKGKDPVPISLNDTIKEAISLVERQLSAHGIKIILNLNHGLPLAKGRVTLIEQAIINIMINAMHALDKQISQDKKITVVTDFSNNKCILEITDNGPGIHPDYLNKIFDPFFTTREGSENMGFGLFIVQNNVSEMGGTVHAKNNKDGGAQFTIKLPSCKPVEKEQI